MGGVSVARTHQRFLWLGLEVSLLELGNPIRLRVVKLFVRANTHSDSPELCPQRPLGKIAKEGGARSVEYPTALSHLAKAKCFEIRKMRTIRKAFVYLAGDHLANAPLQ